MKNLIIFLAYHFPPGKGVGGKRIVRLIRFLDKKTYDYRVISVDQNYAEGVLESKEKKIIDPKKVYYMDVDQTWLNIFYDTYGWHKNALGKTLECIEQALDKPPKFNKIILFSSQPPAITHYIAYKAKKIYGAKITWVADFRDPWQEKYWGLEKLTGLVHATLQDRVLKTADLITTTTSEISKTFKTSIAHKHYVLPNSIDSDLFNNIEKRPQNDTITISHFGDLDYEWRNPRSFLHGFSLASKGPCQDFFKNVQIHFWGKHATWNGKGIPDFINEFQLEGKVFLHDYIPHAQALAEMLASDLLILFALNQKTQIPSKVYEYLYAKKSILAFCEESSATGMLLAKFMSAKILPNQDTTLIQHSLEKIIPTIRQKSAHVGSTNLEHRLTTEVVADDFFNYLKKGI